MFSREFIEELHEKISLVELISEYTQLKKTGMHLYTGTCPNPKHRDSTPSFRVFLKGYKNGDKINKYDTWACMGCHSGSKDMHNKDTTNYGSDCIAFYQWIKENTAKESVTFGKAVRDLAKKYGIPIPTSEFDSMFKYRRRQMESFEINMYSYPKEYLYSRGLTDKDIRKWHLGCNGPKITFPLLDRYENPIAFTNRWIIVPEGRNDKYKNSSNDKIFNKSQYLYGLHNLTESCEELRITEGPMDVIMATKFEAKNIVATLGTAFTDSHVEIIKRLNKVPVFILDGDKGGQDAINRAICKLAYEGIYCKILIIPNNEDLCELSLKQKYNIENYINANSVTYGQYKLNKIVNSFDSQLNELKLKSYKEIATILEEIPYEPERNIMKEYILKRMDIRF